MKVRKLAVALALAGGLGSGVAQALGLGEIEIQSYLNQPLDAEIDVNRAEGVSPDDIFVNLASERAYERVGLTRDHFLTQLDFSVTTAADGELVITVTSKDPVREPYLNFLVEVSWPSGRVMREYSVLVDPPVYAEESGDGDQVQPARTERQAAERTEQPARRETAPREGGAAAADSGPRRLGPVQASDTLWEIARSVRPDSSVSVQQVMLALQDLNEDAFMDGNINRLKRGAVLRVPDMDDIRARSAAQANREVDAQNRALARPEPAVDATEDRAAARDGADGAGQQEAPDELRLVVPEESGDDARREGSAGGDGRQQGTADAGEAVALEELDRVERENEELNSRLEDLQDQVETLQRLIELKDTQLAEMQQGAAAGEDEEPETTAADDEAEPADEATADDEAPDGADADGEPAAEDDQQQPEAVEEDEAGESDEAAEEDETAAPEEPDTATGEPAEEGTGEQPEVTTDEQPEQPEQEQAEQERGFLATAIDLIAGNFLYQIALGGFLVLLLLLVLMISRRRANRDNEFYQQFDEETGDDAFDLNLGEEETAAPAGVLEEADRYVSYGQHDAAAEVLENAISREPSRSDLRLKLLAVYADTGNRAAFDKQYAELEAMEFDDVQPEAEALRARLEDVESTPSIDELESQLRSSDRGAAQGDEGIEEPAPAPAPPPADDDTNELMTAFDELDLPEEEPQEADEAQDDNTIDYDFTGFDTSDAEAPQEENSRLQEAAEEGDLGDIDFELPEDETELSETEKPVDLEDDLTSLELDDAGIDHEPEAENVEGAADTTEEEDLDFGDLDLDTGEAGAEPVDRSSNPEDEAELDESFLDELDAELDKVASEDAEDTDRLDELELDVSDEDLALMDEVSESEPEDESQLDLGDLDIDEAALTGEEAPAEDDLSDLEIPELDTDETEDAPATGADRQERSAGIDDIDEAALGEEDDFDFLSGTDEVATKLDLARAYVDMGDSEGAREILEEVILEGSDEQKSEAQSLLKKLP